jgi:hypothetical protein
MELVIIHQGRLESEAVKNMSWIHNDYLSYQMFL